MRGQMFWLGLIILLLATPLVAQDRLQLIEQGRKFFFDEGCFGCHTVGKVGTPIGPNLSEVGSKYPLSYLTAWLRICEPKTTGTYAENRSQRGRDTRPGRVSVVVAVRVERRVSHDTNSARQRFPHHGTPRRISRGRHAAPDGWSDANGESS